MKTCVDSVYLSIYVVLFLTLSFIPTTGASEIKNFNTYESEPVRYPEDDSELERLLAVIKKQTEIATKTKLNSDYVPGIVTVLNGYELETMGVRNVAEALTTVAGIDINIGINGTLKPIVRGITYGFGKLKTMLNGVNTNATLDGDVHSIYFIPIEQVERIDIIRGPGSSLYGNFAYSGVINVITRKNENRFFARYGRFDDYTGGVVFNHEIPERDFKVGFNISWWQRDDTDVDMDSDGLRGTLNENVSVAPEDINDARDGQTTILTLNYRDLYFLGQQSQSGFGAHYGYTGALPPEDNRLSQEDNRHMAEAGWDLKINSDLNIKIKLGWRDYEWEADDVWLFPEGYGFYDDSGNLLMSYDNGMRGSSHYEEDILYGGMEVHYYFGQSHKILIGLEHENTRMHDIYTKLNYDPVTFEPLPDLQKYKNEGNWLKDGKERNVTSIFFQDHIYISKNFILNLGLRYDEYNDTKDRFSPRIAAVYSLTSNHTLKFQYAEAFRPPSFVEMYSIDNPIVLGNPDIYSETIDTTEFQYIYSRPNLTWKTTAFYSLLDDLIGREGTEYKNIGNADTKGLETELLWRIMDSVRLNANISYAITDDRDDENEFSRVARWLGNFDVTYSPFKHWYLSMKGRYVGEKTREEGDARSKLDAEFTADITATVNNIAIKGLSLRTSVNNVFDEDIDHPTHYYDLPDDFRRPGRQWWIQLAYNW